MSNFSRNITAILDSQKIPISKVHKLAQLEEILTGTLNDLCTILHSSVFYMYFLEIHANQMSHQHNKWNLYDALTFRSVPLLLTL